MTRAALICPGRGSYTEASLGCLPADHQWVRKAEEWRRKLELEPLLQLDGAQRFEPQRHLRPANVSVLIYVKSMLDAAEAAREHDVVCVAGNSMGWYTALAVAGALDFEDGFLLVQHMALLQEEGEPGGQVLYPVVDETWNEDPELLDLVQAALDSSGGEAHPSITLGGYRVLAGSPAGVTHLLQALPSLTLGKVTYPFRLAQHGPYHTSLAASVAERAREVLGDLAFHTPNIALVDGRGQRFSPWSTDVDALREYTHGAQVVEPFDFSASVRVCLREWAPARLVLPGPGNSLGGVCGQVLVAEGWRGIRTRKDFTRVQEGADPLLVSMGR
ncbi:MAG: ACP S-malonyltransferase [Planctomycetota bacterium]